MNISVETIIISSLINVWNSFITPEDIINWNFASEDWACPKASNNFEVNGHFDYRMEAKDGSSGFDLKGKFTSIKNLEQIEYELDDGRKVKLTFTEQETGIKVTEEFEAENQNPVELQKEGWQSILNNFKKHVESKK